ncbi:thioredoxin family protein [Demequina lignilytica]|uniref:Thioredoxin family protein n=1 Tax=Demequina lignilytica TaxID=3051663 RepID=A0AAW7M115_9MICO|nr:MULTISPECIES: thioredoxin family protein [unclassified Demequina]MDN4478534.1 thioredoxin family protein [Demequina sp. SYSU T00039-1]MDN4482308.1 thioredoxin family protein [Demequina sp. SYSU T0a273]MDN4486959.1 thioredoxin family protein [Demequina sp. SYSU T00039]MDN4489643.1 thioredoxin family protein [Demequina sp. SYSU T00068]
MDVTILGHGCKNCDALEARTVEALAGLGRTAEVAHIKDDAQIAAYGVMRTPALVADGRVLVEGQVPTAARLAEILATVPAT